MVDPVILKRSEHSITRRAIDEDALKVLYRLHHHGYKGYLVGGAVRDLLLGRCPKDFDIATDARPGEIKKLFKNAFLIGRRFRLAHIRFKGGKIIEVATFRREADTESDTDIHNTFGTPAEDAFRRDLTINGLFYDIASFSIIDYVGGLKDLEDGIIRVIGDPYTRFREDPVRILRVLRHAARLNFAIDDTTAQAIYPHKELLAACPGARTYEEFNKDLSSGYLMPVFTLMDLYGIPPHIFGRIGDFLMDNPGCMAEALDRLSLADEITRGGKELSPEIAFALLFSAWVSSVLHGTARGVDRIKAVHDAFLESGIQMTIPKTVRSNFIQILLIVEAMLSAMQTGRFRWSLKKRAHYQDASSVYALIKDRDLIQETDPFRVAFQRVHESPAYYKRKRARRPRPTEG